MSEHTPGPWEIVELHDLGPCIVAPDGVVAVVMDSYDGRPEDEFYANARLMKTAPDLLAALEPFARLAEVWQEGQVLNYRGVYITQHQAQAAAAAIAKARGE